MNIPGLESVDSVVAMPLLPLPVRTVIAPVASGRVMVSPGSKLTPDALARAGAVTDIVAPSLLHTAGMRAAAAAHPRARLWGVPGCREKHPELSWHGILGVDAWPHEDELSVVPIAGMPQFNESVLFHRASRTLLVTDLVFNLTDASGLGARVILSLFGTWRRLGVSRLFIKSVKDRAAFEASLARIVALDFEHLVPSHGHVVMSAGRARLVEALRERGVHV